MDFRKGYSILKFDGSSRNVIPYIKTEKETNLIDIGINPCDYAYCNQVISELTKLFSNSDHEYEWGGGERVCFISSSINTVVIDNFGWSKNIQVETKELVQLLINKNMLSNNSNFEEIKDIITFSFAEIKSYPLKFRVTENYSYYSIWDIFNGIDITITLEDSDFNVKDFNFRNSLYFPAKYFPQAKLSV